MKVQYRIAIGAAIILAAVIFFKYLIGGSLVALFAPDGTIAGQEISAIKVSMLLMLVVVVPMFVALFTFAWRYRAGNKAANYEPNQNHGASSELMLWVIPAMLVAVLAVLSWKSVHAVDPYQPIASSVPPLTIEVVALQWKWLFIYPQQGIATVNYIEFPEQTPVHFELTADAPMSSFWIPQLGSQIYAMAAMETQLNLIASSTGTFTGKDTEINGAGYAGMTFQANSVAETDFNIWVAQIKQMSSTLDEDAYNTLAEPSTYNPPAYYSSVDPNLYNNVMMKYMMPSSSMPGMAMPGMQM